MMKENAAKCVPVDQEPTRQPFVIGDRVRHVSGTVEGTVMFYTHYGSVNVQWDKTIMTGGAHIDSLEVVRTSKPPKPLLQKAEDTMSLVPYREWSASLNTASIDAHNSFRVKSMIEYAREIPSTEPLASLIFDLANFLEDATKDNPCTGAFCTFDPHESCDICDRTREHHDKVFVLDAGKEREYTPTSPKLEPHTWDKRREIIKHGDRIYVDGFEGWRLVADVIDGEVYYVTLRGINRHLSKTYVIIHVERMNQDK